MKKPKHNIIPKDWPVLERVINEIDISLSEAESQVTSNISVVSAAIDSQLLLVESESADNSTRITTVDSQLLLIESEVASNDSEILLLESECAGNDSEILLLESETAGNSTRITSVDSQLLLVESEVATHVSHQSVNTDDSPTFSNATITNSIAFTGGGTIGSSGANIIVNSNGNLGVGGSPVSTWEKIYVTGSSGITAIKNKNLDTTSYAACHIQGAANGYITMNSYGDTWAGTLFGDSTTNCSAIYTINQRIYFGTYSDKKIVFGTNNTKRFEIPNDGSYGIDFNGVTLSTAEVRLSNGETIDNLTDGTIEFSGKLLATNYIAANLLTACATNAGELDFSQAEKTLTVEDDAIVDQDLTMDASSSFHDLTLRAPWSNYYKFMNREANSLAIQNQTSGSGAFINIFSKDGDGTDPVTLSIISKGTPEAFATRELMNWRWHQIDNQFQINIGAAGSGILWPLAMKVGAYTDQIKLQTDGDVYFNNQVGIGLSPNSRLTIQTSATEGKQAVLLHQQDDDQAYIEFFGNEAADTAKPISSLVEMGTLAGFVRQEVNGTKYWMPYYTAPTGATYRLTIPNGGGVGQASGPLLTFNDTDDKLELTGGHFTITDYNIVQTVDGEATYQVTSYVDNASAASQFVFRTGRGTEASPAVSQDGDRLAVFSARGYSAAAGSFKEAAAIYFHVDGVPDSGGDTTDMPGRVSFWTTPDGAVGAVERFRIGESGGLFAYNLKSGANQATAGAAANEIYHDTDDNSLKIGV